MKKIIFQSFKIALLLYAIQIIVGLLFMIISFSFDTLKSIVVFTAISSIAVAIIIEIIQLIYLKTNKISLTDIDINPKQSISFIIGKNIQEVKKIVENILPNELRSNEFKYDNKNEIYKTETGATVRSWGEIIGIKLTQIDENKTQLFVSIKPHYWTTIIDFGRSAMNIQRIKLAFDKNGL